MSAILTEPGISANERFLLHNVSWETYEQLLKNYESQSVPRFTYDQGDLEIKSPSIPHEKNSRTLSRIVDLICEEREIDMLDLGSVTHKRPDLLKGVEPDGCFYIQNVDKLAGVEEFDLTIHPPPDLLIEIDVTSPSIARFPIYASIGVPEIWLYKKGEVRFFYLEAGSYNAVSESIALPRITDAAVTRFVQAAAATKRPQWLRQVRQWIRSLE